jgi:hypothetical protein
MYALTWESDDGNFHLECGFFWSELAAFLEKLRLHETVMRECARHNVEFTRGAFKTIAIPEDEQWLYAADRT